MGHYAAEMQCGMDGQKVGKLIDNINSWSYAHRCGNGEHSEEQQAIIDKAFKKLRDI